MNTDDTKKALQKDYPLIPMNEITDEARMIAVAWHENATGWIGDKHKLASDIMNYARRQAQQQLSGEMLELVVHGKDMRQSQVEIWERDYGKFPTPGDQVVVTNRRDDGWVEIKCVHPNHIRQYWPPEYFKTISPQP